MRAMGGEDTAVDVAVHVARSLAIMGGSVVVAVAVYIVAARALFRIRRTDRFAQEATERCRWPGRWTIGLLALRVSLPATELPLALTERLQHGLTIAVICAATWWALRLALAIEATLLGQLDLDIYGSDYARRRQTQVILLRRVTAAVIIIVAIGAVLLTFDEARSLGTSLLASAGVLGLVAGIAAQATLGNLIAGIQIAVAEPIKLDDLVVVEGEWGNIEEISLTYVIVRIWDRRRLVLPTSYFINNPITNWTRGGTDISGTVFWYLDHRTPVEAMRREFLRRVDGHPLWDRKEASLLVTDTREDVIEVRAMITAADAWQLWDLRCSIREGMLAWLAAHHPEALPTRRLLEAAPTPDSRAPDAPEPTAPRHRDEELEGARDRTMPLHLTETPPRRPGQRDR
jgi:small-conductance mechanosensitive channel